MNQFRTIFLGFLVTFTSSWIGLVALPSIYYGRAAVDVTKLQPGEELLLARHGEQVYAVNGCVYCHTQQVRSPQFGNDDKRNWGARRSVAADYLGDRLALLGTMRTGPDLANIGQRMPSAGWHFQHLYEPTSTSPGSTMPAYRFLFERKPVVNGKPDDDAVVIGNDGQRVDADGQQVVPTAEARALVAYLLSLKRTAADRPETQGETSASHE